MISGEFDNKLGTVADLLFKKYRLAYAAEWITTKSKQM
jgi:hypothetical protein